MPELFPFLLFLHVLGAIIAVGPTFAFPLIGSMGGQEPQHANFATRVSHLVGDRIVEPFILSTAVTGIGLIWARSIPVFHPAYRWLLLSIVLYVIAMSFSLFVQRRAVIRVIRLSGGHAPSPIPALASPGPGAAGGPPPELLETIGQVGRNGKILTVLSVAIVFLMVLKPTLGA